MEEKNKPVISNRDKTLSVSVFRHDKTDDFGKVIMTFGFSAQRGYKLKDKDEWAYKEISMFPEEAIRLANLLIKSYNETLTYADMNRPQRKQAEHPQASLDAPADMPQSTYADLDDDIPFA